MAHQRQAIIVFKTISPMHIGSFEPQFKNDEGHNVSGVSMEKFIDADSNVVRSVPVVPSNSLGGGLRREMALHIIDNLRERTGRQISLPMYHGLTCGSIGSKPNSGTTPLSRILAARRDPLLGLMGGSPSMFRSGMKISAGLPIIYGLLNGDYFPVSRSFADEHLQPIAVRIKDNYSGADTLCDWPDLLEAESRAKCDDPVEGRDPLLHVRVENCAVALSDYVKSVEAAKLANEEAAKEGKRGEGKIDVRNIINHNHVMAGVPFAFTLSFEDWISPAQIRFALESITNVLSKPLGGRGARGYGAVRVDMNASQFKDGDDIVPLFDKNSEQINPDIGEDFSDLISSVTFEVLEALWYVAPEKPKKVKANKKATSEDVLFTPGE